MEKSVSEEEQGEVQLTRLWWGKRGECGESGIPGTGNGSKRWVLIGRLRSVVLVMRAGGGEIMRISTQWVVVGSDGKLHPHSVWICCVVVTDSSRETHFRVPCGYPKPYAHGIPYHKK
uniref:Uncharacterized protein n=1 Tax=Ananas comosus var. bracteatus TaxID=296719 RepID=A0A6V7PA87_ANACO|nr:unnamed protein product [Ananas comosus var. bracteatus]